MSDELHELTVEVEQGAPRFNRAFAHRRTDDIAAVVIDFHSKSCQLLAIGDGPSFLVVVGS